MFNLYPYNMWILYAALILLLLVLVVTAVRCLPLLKALKKMKSVNESVQKNVALAQIKVSAVREASEAKKKKMKPVLAALPILLAVLKAYDKEEENGVPGFRKATEAVIREKQTKKGYKDLVSSLLS